MKMSLYCINFKLIWFVHTLLPIFPLLVAPDISVAEPSVTVVEGGTATLTCLATGDPVPVQTWSQNGNRLISGGRYQISSDGRVLTVQGVMEAQDEGMFTCHASNMAGNDSADITLNVLSKMLKYMYTELAYWSRIFGMLIYILHTCRA